MEKICTDHSLKSIFYCLTCQRPFCIVCNDSRKDCLQKGHQKNFIKYKDFKEGWCQQHKSELIHGCVGCKKAFCLNCKTEELTCQLKDHMALNFDYEKYKQVIEHPYTINNF